MCKIRLPLALFLGSLFVVGCSKDYQVDPEDLDSVSSGAESSGSLSSGEIPGSSGAINSSQQPGSSGANPSMSSGAHPSSSSVLVVNPDTLHWVGNSPVQITEIDPNNLTWTDHQGNDPGWVEVYNPAGTAVNLKGFSFVENLTTPRKWVFGNVSVPAKSYRTIFCSNLDLATPPAGAETLGKNRAHTNWKLEGKGGTLYVLDSNLGIRDSLVYPSIPNSVSWGILDSKWGFLTTITPEKVNVAPQFTKISNPVSFSAGGGFFTTAQSIAIPSTGGTVRCTQDGSEPTESTPAITGSIAITKNTVLRCASFEAGAVRGPISTQSYFIGETISSIPVVSIAVDPYEMFDEHHGLYRLGDTAQTYAEPFFKANFHSDRKVAVSVEYFGRDKGLKWKSDGGLNIMGNWSRMFPKKSLSIKFSENFNGSALDYPLFPSHPTLKKFKAFILRNGGNNYDRDYIRDALMSTSTEGLGIDYQKSDYVIVFMNGEYYGIHNLREKMNEDFIKTNYDIDAQTVDVISLSGDAEPEVDISAGSDQAFQTMMSYLESTDLANAANYAQFQTMVDVENYANYVGAEVYFRNTDWPGNNVKMWRTSSPAGPFKFMLFDTDHGYAFPYASGGGNPNFDMIDFMACDYCNAWPNPKWSTLMFRKLIENPTWKPLFINRLATMLSHWFTPTRMKSQVDALMGLINSETARDIDHWNDEDFLPSFYEGKYVRSKSDFAVEIDVIKGFAEDRPGYVRDHLRNNFSLGANASLTMVATGPGKIHVHGLPLPTASFTGSYFNGYAVELTAVPLAGATFTGWSDGVQTVTRTVTPGTTSSITATFQ